MSELSRFGSKGDGGAKDAGGVPDARQAQGPGCPECGAQVPSGSRYCPLCGSLTDRSPEGLAAFSSGPQFAMMKVQLAAVQDIQAEASAMRRSIQWMALLNSVGWIIVVFLLWVIATSL